MVDQKSVSPSCERKVSICKLSSLPESLLYDHMTFRESKWPQGQRVVPVLC